MDEIFATYFEAIKYCNKFSRLKVLTFINEKKSTKRKKKKKKKNERKETSALKYEAVVPSQSTDRHL